MRTFFTNRGLITLACLLGGAGVAASAQYGGQRPPAPPQGATYQQAPAPVERRAPGPAREPMMGPAPAVRGPKGHLGQWMAQHSNLAPAEQQQALEREPGFRQLPPEQQQHMRERLSQLDAMSPVERQRMITRNEAMERLSPDQRQQVRGAMSQLGSLRPDQRQMVARCFRELRQLPPGQRVAAVNSGRYGYLNGMQRAALDNLLRVEPMLPPQ